MRPAGSGLRRMLGVAAAVPSPCGGLVRAPAKHGVWSRYRMLVFFLKKIQKEKCKFLLAYFSGCAYTRLRYGGSSSVGRAPGCGPGGRGFKSHLSPHKEIPPLSSGVFLFLPPGYGLPVHQRSCAGSPGREFERTAPLLARVHGRGHVSFAGEGLREILFRRGRKRLARPACSLSSLSIDGALSAVVICLASERGPRSCPAGGGFSLRAGNALGLQTGRPCQSRAFCVQNIPSRSVAQHGSAPALGAGGRWFESSRSDQIKSRGYTTGVV